MKYILLIMLINSLVYSMNDKIIPIITVSPPSPSMTDSSMTDDQLCSFALNSFCKDRIVPMNPEIIPYIAKQMMGSVHNGQIEEGDINHLILQAVNEALEEKERRIAARISKKHSAYIAIATGILSTTITALAAIYNTQNNNKC